MSLDHAPSSLFASRHSGVLGAGEHSFEDLLAFKRQAMGGLSPEGRSERRALPAPAQRAACPAGVPSRPAGVPSQRALAPGQRARTRVTLSIFFVAGNSSTRRLGLGLLVKELL